MKLFHRCLRLLPAILLLSLFYLILFSWWEVELRSARFERELKASQSTETVIDLGEIDGNGNWR